MYHNLFAVFFTFQSSREGFISITQTLNRLFIPAEKRRHINGHPHILHNDLDIVGHKTNDTAPRGGQIPLPIGPNQKWYTPAYHYALDTINATKQGDDRRAVILQSDLDGVFPMSRPKNLTIEQIYDCETSGLNQLPLIPPHTEITLRLKLNDPIHLRCIDSFCPSIKYFGPTNPTGNEIFPSEQDVKFQILEMHLLVEKIKWRDERIQRQLSSGGASYHFDQYIFRSKALVEKQTNPNYLEHIPAFTQLVYFCFLRNNQLYKDASKLRSSDGTRFSFPANLTHITFRLNGRVILFENGLNMNRNNARSQEDTGLFYQYMRSRGWTDDEKETFYPVNGPFGYKQCFPLDLSPYALSEPGIITVDTTWTGGVPADMYACLFIPQSVHIAKDAGSKIWKSTATIS